MTVLRYLPAALSAAIILGTGLIFGQWTNRWGVTADVQRVVDAFPRLPMAIGQWEGQDTEATEVFGQLQDKGELTGFLLRRYVHRPTGVEVSLMLACGPSGPMATHNPQTCYGGADGRELRGPLQRVESPAGEGSPGAAFLRADYGKVRSDIEPLLRIYWSYRGRGDWIATDDARVDFAGVPQIYKIYIIRQMPDTAKAPKDELTPQFLAELIPALEENVFALAR